MPTLVALIRLSLTRTQALAAAATLACLVSTEALRETANHEASAKSFSRYSPPAGGLEPGFSESPTLTCVFASVWIRRTEKTTSKGSAATNEPLPGVPRRCVTA